MSKPEISGIAPFFIVDDVPTALAFYLAGLAQDGSARINVGFQEQPNVTVLGAWRPAGFLVSPA